MATIAEKVEIQEKDAKLFRQIIINETVATIKQNLAYWENLILSNKWKCDPFYPERKIQNYPKELLYDYFKKISCCKKLGKIAFSRVMTQQGITVYYYAHSFEFDLPA